MLKQTLKRTLLKRPVMYIILILGCVATIVVTSVLYYRFAQSNIFRESKSHLTEIYNQTNAIFGNTVKNNHKLLSAWDKYIGEMVKKINTDESTAEVTRQDLKNFVNDLKGRWEFENFYFIGQSGVSEPADPSVLYKNTVECKTYAGDLVTLRVHREFDEYLSDEQGGVIAIRDGETSKHMLFAIKSDKKSYDGFEYSAIGFTFAEDDVLSILSRDAYNGKGQYCLALYNGDVLMKTDPSHKVTNVFKHFVDDNVTITDYSLSQIQNDFSLENQKTNTVVIEERGNTFYWSYRPVGFGGWMLVGIISTDTVNSNLNTFGNVTMIAAGVIFFAIFAAAAVMLISANKQRVKTKSLEVTLRDNMLDTLSLNSKDIFIMFSGSTFKADYVSSNVERVLGLDMDKIREDVRTLLDACQNDAKPFTTDGLGALPVGESWDADIKLKHITEDVWYFYHLIMSHSIINGKDVFIMTLSDRTSDKTMQEKLVDALNIAKSANDAKSNFLSNMSHDIRTPMNAIIGYSTLLAKESTGSERIRDYTRKITYSGQHLLGLINDILDMSKIESGKTSLNIEEFNLPEFIEEVYSIMESQASAKKLDFEVHTKGALPECVFGDKLRLNRVILNILSNAVKYTPQGGSIDFSVEALKQTVHNHAHIRFTVADTGIGMSPEYLKTIFEPFSRDNTAAAASVQGTGLGMAIAKNIIDLMGGTISVESTLDKGSTFCVEVELAVADSLPQDEKFWQRHNVTRVLVVDDFEDVCVYIKELMSDTGVEIHYALSGEQAIQDVKSAMANGTPFDMALLDWKMPVMDGLETAKHIREIVGNELPVMILTSYSFNDIEAEAKQAGINLFMAKPFSVSNFKRAVIQLSGEADTVAPEPHTADYSLQGLKVLAAEDNALNAEILVELLDGEGVKCDVAVNGKEVFEQFEASEVGKYDMIFMDIQMPIMNGYDAARAIRAGKHKNAKKIPIIAMTANAFDTDVKAALDAGMNAHIAKPLDINKLKQAIAKINGKKNKK